MWQQPLVAVETYGTSGVTRTSTTSYDAAGRTLTSALAVSPTAAGGTAVPTVTTAYSTSTGLPTTVSTPAATITTGYDTLGRTTSYTDADTNQTVTTYDISGRPATVNDGKATSTYTYDSPTEHRGLTTDITDTQAGTFTATYDNDATPNVQTYPGGLTATSSHDNAGNPTRLDYTKAGNTWATFTNSSDIDGKVRSAASPGSSQNHQYDNAGRLTQTDDTAAESCTRRGYAFNAPAGLNSDRTDLTTTDATPGTGGDCDLTGTTPTTTSRGYDTADRLVDTGYTYDTLGRTLTVPAADAASPTDSLTVGYQANDLVEHQTQAGRTITFGIDPADRIHTQTDSATSKTQTQHYTAGTDSPAWTAVSDGTWTRNLTGCDGDLAAITKSDGSTELQLPNLHGDIVAVAAPADTTGYTSYFESTEYGSPRTTNTFNPKYGWLGAKQRSTDDVAGLTLMGVRQYDSATGRFLTVDPVTGGSANAYDYANQDPINNFDLDGRFSWRKWGRHMGHGIRFARNARISAYAVGYAYARHGSCRFSRGLTVNCQGVQDAHGNGGFTVGNVWLHQARNSSYSVSELRERQRHEARHSSQYAILGVGQFSASYAADWAIHGGHVRRMWLERAAGLKDGHY